MSRVKTNCIETYEEFLPGDIIMSSQFGPPNPPNTLSGIGIVVSVYSSYEANQRAEWPGTKLYVLVQSVVKEIFSFHGDELNEKWKIYRRGDQIFPKKI